MEQSTHRPPVRTSPESHSSVPKRKPSQNRRLLIIVLVVLALVVVFLLVRSLQDKPKVTYENTNTKTTASFAFDIDFKRNCKDQKNCDPNKPSYDGVKLFVFNQQGMQVRVVRSDSDGVFQASIPEGDYTLVVAKTFEGKKGLPQETVSLKNGKLLKLKVNYGTELAVEVKK